VRPPTDKHHPDPNVTASFLDSRSTQVLPLDAAEGRCTAMEIRDWLELARLELGGLRRDDGQTMTEYGVLLALIAVVVIVTATVLGGKVATIFGVVSNSL